MCPGSVPEQGSPCSIVDDDGGSWTHHLLQRHAAMHHPTNSTSNEVRGIMKSTPQSFHGRSAILKPAAESSAMGSM